MSIYLWNSSFHDPWAEMERMRRDMDTMFGSLQDSNSTSKTLWNPACDIKETEKDIVVHAELPGMKKEDVNIEMKDNLLTISGEKKNEKVEKNDKYHRTERSWGYFSRSIPVPRGLKEEQIKAKFEDGVLEVSYPKEEIAKQEERKRIKIQ